MPVYAGMSQSGAFSGIEGTMRLMMIGGAGAIITGALIYSPVTGLGYGAYASGATIAAGSIAGGFAALYATSKFYN